MVRAEKASGSRRDRTELQVLLHFAQPGDALVVARIERLARSMRDLQDIVHELGGKGAALRAVPWAAPVGVGRHRLVGIRPPTPPSPSAGRDGCVPQAAPSGGAEIA